MRKVTWINLGWSSFGLNRVVCLGCQKRQWLTTVLLFDGLVIEELFACREFDAPDTTFRTTSRLADVLFQYIVLYGLVLPHALSSVSLRHIICTPRDPAMI